MCYIFTLYVYISYVLAFMFTKIENYNYIAILHYMTYDTHIYIYNIII